MIDSMERLSAKLDEFSARPEPTTPAEYMAVIEEVLTEFNAAFAEDEKERAQRKKKEDEDKLEALWDWKRQAALDIQRLQSDLKFFKRSSEQDHQLTGIKAENAMLREVNRLYDRIIALEKRVETLEKSR